MNYEKLYDAYWSLPDRFGSSSFTNEAKIVKEILQVCGYSRVLDIGCGMGKLVDCLISYGFDAQGVDVSSVAVRHANSRMPGRFTQASALELPFGDSSFDTVVSTHFLEHLHEIDVPRALEEMYRVCSRTLFLKLSTVPDRDKSWQLTLRPREWWESQLFAAGFRKHPAAQCIVSYEALENEGYVITIVMQKIHCNVLAAYPLEKLAAERDLHMDMTRESGRRSDAHISRYVHASRYIRPGDLVLDVACGLGYGSEILAENSSAGRVIGIDNSEFAIDYATSNFGDGNNRIEFRCHDAADFATMSDNSVDIVVSMETLEHLPDPRRFLAEIARVLKPAGRLIVSVPNLWVDETGRDPNPYHLHEYDLERVREEVAEYLCVEEVWRQIAGGGMKYNGEARLLRQVDVHSDGSEDAEWWLIVAMKPTSAGFGVPRIDNNLCPSTDPKSYVADFSHWYDNPWLIPGMVVRGERASNKDLLVQQANDTLLRARHDSADYGAALCVLGYAMLDVDYPINIDVGVIEQEIQSYLNVQSKNPHVIRWQISLSFLLGLMARMRGDLDQAERQFLGCVKRDPLDFSPLIATKTIGACLELSKLYRSRNQEDKAVAVLKRGIQIARNTVGKDWPNVIGTVDKPLRSGFYELSEVCDLAAQCVFEYESMIRHWSPGYTWRRGQIAHLEQISNLNQALLERDANAQELAREVVRLDARAQELAREVAEKDARAQELAREVVRLDARAQELAREVAEKDAHAQELAREVIRLKVLSQELAYELHAEQSKTFFQRLFEKVMK